MPADDALGLFQSLRPQAPGPSADMRGGRGDLQSLAMVPGTPGYNSRIPRPPCFQCGEDHLPNHDYGHNWVAEPVIHDEPVSATAIMNRPAPVYDAPGAVIPQSPKRVVLYVGRGDSYVLAVEEAPDWESAHTFRVAPELVLPLVRMARALGTKVLDKTGGDLLMLEQEDEDGRSQSQAPDERSTPRVRDRQPRRQGLAPARQEEDQPGSGEGEAG